MGIESVVGERDVQSGRPGESTSKAGIRFRVSILERHPYTTQTFCPLGLSPTDRETFFLVVVAPTLDTASSSSRASEQSTRNPPDLTRLRAFLARGDQAVTYGAGTWHAPMVVLGTRRVDFVVTQFANGVADDDCQEALLGANIVRVELRDLGLSLSLEKEVGDGGQKAKL